MKTFVLYHASCADGFGAAFAAWTAYQENATYLPVRYDEPVPEMPDGSAVFILDFSYPRSVLMALAERMAMVRVIDHHATAAEDLAGLDFALFDQSKSGAVLTWEYFFPETPVPELLLYVQDRDLWRWKLPESREVSAALAMRPFDFDGWLCADIEQLRAEGRIARRVIAQAAERQARNADWREVGGVRVPVVNATMFISETCEEMKSLWPDAPFVASYFVKPNRDRVWSLRCGEDGDVRAVAERLGGGGHRQAAGFTQRLGSSVSAWTCACGPINGCRLCMPDVFDKAGAELASGAVGCDCAGKRQVCDLCAGGGGADKMTIDRAREITSACCAWHFKHMGIVETAPSIKGFSLREMLDATEMVSRLNEKGNPGKSSMSCDPRLVAALYVAAHYDGGTPERPEVITAAEGNVVVLIEQGSVECGDGEEGK